MCVKFLLLVPLVKTWQEEIRIMVEKIMDKAWARIETRLKDLIVKMVEVAKSAAPEVPKNAVNIEGLVDLPGITGLGKIHLIVKVDMSKL
jgi:hypothetical protein